MYELTPLYNLFVQLYERRMSQAKGKQHQLLCKLNEKAMSDEESDPDEQNSLIRRPPPWRNEKLNALFASLDQQYEAKHSPSTKRKRKIGPPTERIQPRGLPVWALSTAHTPESRSAPTPTNTAMSSSNTTPTHSTAPTVWAPGPSVSAQDSLTPVRNRSTSRLSVRRDNRELFQEFSSQVGDSASDGDSEFEEWIQYNCGWP